MTQPTIRMLRAIKSTLAPSFVVGMFFRALALATALVELGFRNRDHLPHQVLELLARRLARDRREFHGFLL